MVIPDGSVAWRFSQSIEEAEEAKVCVSVRGGVKLGGAEACSWSKIAHVATPSCHTLSFGFHKCVTLARC